MSARATGGARVRAAVLAVLAVALGLAVLACGAEAPDGSVVRFPGSAVGAEGELLRRQVARFEALHPGVRVVLQPTPDAADQRRQLYVQWLNAGVSDPDVLQLDVVWTAEFAEAGWLAPLPEPAGADAFVPAMERSARWRGRTWARPWFVDVAMLYWRTDLLARPPGTWGELRDAARRARAAGQARDGLALPLARYEGLVTVFVELVTAFGGAILDGEGRVAVDREPAVRALRWLRDAVRRDGIVPADALAWQEEHVRFAFQNGDALFMRNWPYALPLLRDSEGSRVAGRFAVAPLPAGPAGRSAAALGGQLLAVNAGSDVPGAARALVDFLAAPEQMAERARATGQWPARPAVLADPGVAAALGLPAPVLSRLVESAVPRPVSPLYSELSEVLQVRVHRVLAGLDEPRPALADAAREMRRRLARVGLAREEAAGARP